MNFKSMSIRLVPLALAAVVSLGAPLSNVAIAAPVSSGGASKDGQACTVTAGANAGKTGTYTTEEGTGHTWCEGSWGGTDCTGGRCKDATRVGTISGALPVLRSGSFSFMR